MKNGASRWIAVLALLAVLAGVALSAWLTIPKPAPQIAGTWLDTPRALPPFTLQREGGTLANADFEGHWTLVFPGYTFCPDVCPTVLATLKAVNAKLADPRVKVLMLSVDPGRDTPERLASYVHAFSPDFTGATAPDADLNRLAPAFGFVFARVNGQTPETYLMDHSAALILIDPKGRVAGYLSPPFSVTRLTADLQQILATSPT